jgi:nicotinamide mononucleotide transporter
MDIPTLGNESFPYLHLFLFIELIAAFTSVACVWLAARNHILNWPVAIVAALLYAITFFHNRFYSEAYLQFLFVLFQIYGWWNWSHTPFNKQNKDIQNLPVKHILPIALVFILSYLGWYFLYLQLNPDAQMPALDTFLTILSLLAIWMQAKRWIEHWYLWILADLMYVPMFYLGGNFITSGLYLLFIGMAINGLISWKAISLKQKTDAKIN